MPVARTATSALAGAMLAAEVSVPGTSTEAQAIPESLLRRSCGVVPPQTAHNASADAAAMDVTAGHGARFFTK